MQTVSNGFRQAIIAHDRPYDEVYGTVTFSDNTTLDITPSIINDWDVSVARQCISGDELEFGGVFLGRLEMTLVSNESRYAFDGAIVDLYYRIFVNGSFESLKLGKFTISEPDKPTDNTVKFKAYDDMKLLDKPLESDALSGTVFGLFNLISQKTGYPLAFDDDFLSQFPNYDAQQYFDSSSGLKTYRDVVKALCILLGCFAEDDRHGRLILRKFGEDVVSTLTTARYYNVTPADYLCNYIALTVTSAKGTYQAMLEGSQTGLTMNIADAPAWDYGVDTTLQNYTVNLFEVLKDITYTPCEIDMPSDPTFDCGDRIEVVTDTGSIESIITGFEWKWHNGMTIESKGKNPYITGASTSDIASARLLNKSAESGNLIYYTYENGDEIEIGTEFVPIAELRFRVSAITTLTLWHEFKWTNEFTGETQTVTLNYYYDDELISYEPIQTYGEEGIHTWGTQYWLLEVSVASSHTWVVEAKVDNGTAKIDISDLHALLMGQKLYETTSGYDIPPQEDIFEPLQAGAKIVGFTDSMPDEDNPTLVTEGGGSTSYLKLESGGYLELEQGGYLKLEDNGGN